MTFKMKFIPPTVADGGSPLWFEKHTGLSFGEIKMWILNQNQDIPGERILVGPIGDVHMFGKGEQSGYIMRKFKDETEAVIWRLSQ